MARCGFGVSTLRVCRAVGVRAQRLLQIKVGAGARETFQLDRCDMCLFATSLIPC